MIMDRLYGGVCYAGIDTDPELKYPKVNLLQYSSVNVNWRCHFLFLPQGAGRVAFSNQQSYIAAISARFVQLQHGDIDKRVEVKPYVLDDQMCDECGGQRCSGKFAPFFCANVTCLQVRLINDSLVATKLTMFCFPSTTASTAGPPFIPVPDANITSHWSRKAPIVHAPFHFAGVKLSNHHRRDVMQAAHKAFRVQSIEPWVFW